MPLKRDPLAIKSTVRIWEKAVPLKKVVVLHLISVVGCLALFSSCTTLTPTPAVSEPPPEVRAPLQTDASSGTKVWTIAPMTLPEAVSSGIWQVTLPATDVGPPRLRPGLQLRVSVLVAGEKEVDEPVKRISAAGTITLPLIGLVDCTGLTIETLTAKLTKKYAEFLQEPSVDVDFVIGEGPDAISPWGQVTVLGRVKQPGRINIPPTRDLSLSKAIQLSGGLDTSAKITSIRITRRDQTGQTRQLDINFQSIGVEGSLEKDLPLQDGDVIFVPESVF